MNRVDIEQIKDFSIKFRPMFGKVITEIAEKNPDVYLVVADSARAGRINGFPSCPKQFVDCGIAEQNMTGVAAGLAHCGKKPVTFAFSPFASERCFEQVRLDVAYAQMPVVIVGSEGGVGMGTQGVTHFGYDDIGAMSSLPGMNILCPADHTAMIHCLEEALMYGKPVYLRLNGGVPEPLYGADTSFKIGGSHLHGTGKDVNFIAAGPLVQHTLRAAKLLAEEGIDAGVLDAYSIKPLDEAAVGRMCAAAPLVVTVEEHSVVNGLGSRVAEVMACSGSGSRLLKLGLPDEYPHCVSPYPVMLEDYGLTAEKIVHRVLEEIRK